MPKLGRFHDDALDSIDWGTRVRTNDVTVYFAGAGETFARRTSEGWSAYETARAMAALETFEAVSGLTFREVSRPGRADFKLVIDDFGARNDLGFFFPPREHNAGVGVFNSRGVGWNPEKGARSGLEAGGLAFETLVHEFAHGLGLAHPHDRGGRSELMRGVRAPFDDYGRAGLNKTVFTVMSYNRGGPGGDGGVGSTPFWGTQAGPAALDITVLQAKYGANDRHATGDDVYVLPTGDRRGTYFSAIWDAGGVDEIRHRGELGAIIDLRPAAERGETAGGFVSSARKSPGGFTIAAGVEIENASGGRGRDTIIGNAADNRLKGGAGADAMDGDSGRDVLLGGSGADTLYGGRGGDRLDGGGGGDSVQAGEGRDLVQGRGGDDRIAGDAGDDDLRGGGGRDRLWGEAGDDRLVGGGGDDVLIGDAGGDSLFGGEGEDLIWGGAGADVIDGGAGKDRMGGEDGADRFVFAAAPEADRIVDFEPGLDVIDVSGAGYAAGQMALIDLGDDRWRVRFDDGAILVLYVDEGTPTPDDFLFA
ncbi:M10 family metallopeptidase C-terminal domain-containing protein [Albimonas pacifica]|uniref:Hemolysin-type calcium-binding repeat-containing protein n=1 Tax=Albimonas pacifica TaxID=1114924 RepID=A0A1I3F937_9RHOB|nr:M10 family metallopeptidase C-terminal domain-containing protein [Albimonas pacifica]SFI07733.1 Hemolysin-type calcium-binding repeat-containing protein [Albimonas pacifica]